MDLEEVTEGATPLLVPTTHAHTGDGPKKASQAFYNPAMALTRDLTVLAARAHQPPHDPQFLDALAATGARGLRVAHETPDWLVTLNDRARRTTHVAQQNTERLDLQDRVVVRRQDANQIMATGRWAFVDIDPYGSPTPYLGLAVRAVDDEGLLGLTATDTTALHGVKQAPGKRRYLGTPPPRNAPGWKAAASRYLVAAIVREAARYDRRADPLLVHHHQHAIRAIVRITDGAAAADQALDELSTIALCPRCQGWGEHACPCGTAEPTGPYVTGPLHEPRFIEALQQEATRATLAQHDAVATLLERLHAEASLGPFPLDVDQAVKARNAGGPPARDALRDALHQEGIRTARTHYGPTTLAHDGDPAKVLKVLDELANGA